MVETDAYLVCDARDAVILLGPCVTPEGYIQYVHNRSIRLRREALLRDAEKR